MGKIISITILCTGLLFANESVTDEITLQNTCLNCHKRQQIPNALIYKRYLMKYSTPERIEEVMVHYLKAPKKSHSIMPPQFFLKFPMKEPLMLDEKSLRDNVRAYLKKFDVKQYLILKNSIE